MCCNNTNYVFKQHKVAILVAEKTLRGWGRRLQMFLGKTYNLCVATTQNMCSNNTKSQFWLRKNLGYALLVAEKAPAGMGTPRPGFAKLRVSLERHFSGAKIAQWFGPRTPESRCVFYTENTLKSDILAAEKPRIRNFAGGKKPLREWGHHAPDLLS